jgi:hypothetical protein
MFGRKQGGHKINEDIDDYDDEEEEEEDIIDTNNDDDIDEEELKENFDNITIDIKSKKEKEIKEKEKPKNPKKTNPKKTNQKILKEVSEMDFVPENKEIKEEEEHKLLEKINFDANILECLHMSFEKGKTSTIKQYRGNILYGENLKILLDNITKFNQERKKEGKSILNEVIF